MASVAEPPPATTKPKSAKASKNPESKPKYTLSIPTRDTDVPDSDMPKKEKYAQDESKGTSRKTASEVKMSKKRKRTTGGEVLNESIDPEVDTTPLQEEGEMPKKHHKRETMTSHEQITERSQKDKKKKHQHELPFPDPTKDGSLAEQNCKALSYAYERFRDPQSWKFNKARQNWLIRNVWSEKAIPENYVPLLTKYLADIKGSARQKLIDSCHLKVSPIVVAPMDGGQPHDSIDTEDSSAMGYHPIRSRAHSLLQALGQFS
ncbi:hypothetical protein BS17DRAFT_809654 [Gyrodon lividus]|nr:hypothetical protein BS17DRAFT_809654 [Gyrodon lividus]